MLLVLGRFDFAHISVRQARGELVRKTGRHHFDGDVLSVSVVVLLFEVCSSETTDKRRGLNQRSNTMLETTTRAKK